jgi:O-antigen/teichoic acid export membrane protein
MRDLLKAIFKTGSGSAINIILGVTFSKVMAVVLGSSGVGLYSLINQTLSTATTAGTIGGQTALVQGLASKKGTENDKYLVTVFWIFICGAIIVALSFLLFSPFIAKTVFSSNDEKIISLVRWMSLPVILTTIYAYLISLLNGFRAIGRLAIGQLIISSINVILVYPVSKLVNSGYITTFIFMISVSTIGAIIFCLIVAHREKWLNPLIQSLIPKFDKESAKHFFRIARTTLITSLIGTGTLLTVRSMIIHYGGFSSAGIFSVAWGLSMLYVTLVLSSFGTYYLPTLSGINDVPSRNTLIEDLFRISLILIVPLITTIVVLKSLMITILYTPEFLSSIKIIRWMLMGDYFKVGVWILGMPMIAYGDMKVFFWTESLWNLGLLLISYIGVFYYKDIQTVGIAFLILYVLSFIYFIYYVHTKHSVVLTNNSRIHWILGLLLIVAATLQTWGDTQINWLSAPIWIAVSIGYSWMILKKEEKSKLIRMIYIKKDII